MSEGTSESDDDISLEESLLLCARRGQTSIIGDILQSEQAGTVHVDINCKGMAYLTFVNSIRFCYNPAMQYNRGRCMLSSS
ncbi:hypothetical protein DPMN_021001 [Dreissena polymorpha]|uniref:Uncharacterized protein n=1 Tax=Dreissena polymorpha TaxID=45954 RepID=A0A9D4S8S4_DREPO|nr:hypothetical protein DPMN_021001 [Dreissena polymorpha]